MKKMFYIGLLALALCSCSKEDGIITPQEIEFTLDYTFAESGSMTRAGADVYGAFYDKHIKTKKLTPKTYSLTFKDKSTGRKALEVNGAWDNKISVRLPSGNYTVTGISHPIIENYENSPADTVYMKFSEDVTIKEDMTELVLTAQYDSYLLLFDKTNASAVNYKGVYSGTSSVSQKSQILPLSSDDNIYWSFLTSTSYYYTDVQNNTRIPYENYSISINRKDESEVILYFDGLRFTIGKYYYFNDMTNSFDIPPMESGN